MNLRSLRSLNSDVRAIYAGIQITLKRIEAEKKVERDIELQQTESQESSSPEEIL